MRNLILISSISSGRGLLLFLCILLGHSAASAQPFNRIAATELTADNSFSAGASFGDFNNDGLVDVFVGKGTAVPALFLNTGNAIFQRVNTGDISQFVASNGSSGAWADYDNDGDLDLYVSNKGIPPNSPGTNFLMRNSGPPNHVLERVTDQPVTDPAFTNHSYTSSWVDYDNDGDLDLHVIENGYRLNDFFFENDGNGNFQNVMTPFVEPGTMPGAAQSNWVDYDNDGDQDLLLTMSGRPHGGENNQLFQNMLSESGSLDFLQIFNSGLNHFGLEYSASWGDIDNDGDLDALLGNFDGHNLFYRNDGDNDFTRITNDPVALDDTSTQGSGWADYDNDGDLDLFTVTSNTATNAPGGAGRLFRNDGPQGFRLMTNNEIGLLANLSVLGMGGAWADVDNDGDMDLFVTTLNNDLLWRNDQANGNHWLMLNLEGRVSNRSAIGAQVFVTATIDGESVTQMRHVSGSPTGDRSQAGLRVHFGLADADAVESLRIKWPSGIDEVYEGLSTDTLYRVVETSGASVDGEFSLNPGLNDAWFNPDTDGQGFFINVFPDLKVVSLAWFTYDTSLPDASATSNLGDPGHRWLTALGPITDSRVVMNIDIVSGGIFDTGTQVLHTDPPGSDGTLTLTFEDCNSGMVEYDITAISKQGKVPIQRVANDNIALCEQLAGVVKPAQ